ncbi:pyruvate/2-oxoglutarate dehydrogenase complex dihydrolipoamide dehydrogenase (E3) component [Streptomyces sp. Ag109_O5-1]|nr:FAD-dependent oxidoreductase [Streptomyces sp. Ag109_O5-1]RPE47177.1 pyruvate/2-oxoglutarate dehydrogenase complex dihydrolipoamide dehydrogenase (E3) component [Streptomyces sp. Ag109_O5-1]
MSVTESTENYDILVVGSGEAGKCLAWTTTAEGHRTAVVERKLIGGSCPNVACLPSKNIIHSAKVRSFTRRAAEFGVELESAATNMKGVQARKRAMVEDLRQLHLDRYQASGAELIMSEARFVCERSVDVEAADGCKRRIRGERVFLDLGTYATVPDVPGLAAARPMTHVELLDLDRLPEDLIVIGGGFVALELAQAVRRFGARVTVIEYGPQLASREDADVAAAILDLFRDEGITVHLRTRIRRVDGESGRDVLVITDGPDGECVIDGTDLLVGVGRTPNTGGIGLERAGVKLTDTGYIVVDERLATTAAGVWAMGECAGSPHFTHVAFDDFRVVHDNLHGGSSTTTGRLLAYCLYTDPELARVGCNETQAGHRGIGYRPHPADGCRSANQDAVRAAWIHEDADRRGQRRDPRIHRVRDRSQRTHGRRPDGNDRPHPVHGTAQCDIRPPHGSRRTHFPTEGTPRTHPRSTLIL